MENGRYNINNKKRVNKIVKKENNNKNMKNIIKKT